MSIDLNWEALTSGPDGDALAERIRSVIDDKFQTVPLPRFIRSVKVHGFGFGTVAPELELKDITDPLPDFYEQALDDDEADGGPAAADDGRRRPPGLRAAALRTAAAGHHDVGSPFLGAATPGILGGPGLNYLQGHLATGTHTPLAAVAGAHLGAGWMGPGAGDAAGHGRQASQGSLSADAAPLREKSSVSTLAPTSVSTSRPPTRDPAHVLHPERGEALREAPVDDVQAVFRVRYAGDVRLNLTAEILLDYPMPSFVGIPLKLNITGLSFDGVGVLASIRKRLHFCFLGPDDAAAAVGPDDDDVAAATAAAASQKPGGAAAGPSAKTTFAGLLHEIRVESEIGERDGGKQSLKNVGKVERFVLEQVRRIFDDEFVYPSFWTFLV